MIVGNNILVDGEEYTIIKMYNQFVWRLKAKNGGG